MPRYTAHETTRLHFGTHAYDAVTCAIAAEMLTARGYTVARNDAEWGVNTIETNASYHTALDVKARARAQHRRELLASEVTR
jgi:hypothetical protein